MASNIRAIDTSGPSNRYNVATTTSLSFTVPSSAGSSSTAQFPLSSFGYSSSGSRYYGKINKNTILLYLTIPVIGVSTVVSPGQSGYLSSYIDTSVSYRADVSWTSSVQDTIKIVLTGTGTDYSNSGSWKSGTCYMFASLV